MYVAGLDTRSSDIFLVFPLGLDPQTAICMYVLGQSVVGLVVSFSKMRREENMCSCVHTKHTSTTKTKATSLFSEETLFFFVFSFSFARGLKTLPKLKKFCNQSSLFCINHFDLVYLNTVYLHTCVVCITKQLHT